MWTAEFESGDVAQLGFSKTFQVEVPADKLLYASISLTGITLPGRFTTQSLTDYGDPFVLAKVVEAGGQPLATQYADQYPVFASNPSTWSGRVPAHAPRIGFGIESHLAHATVVVQIIQTDDPLDVIVKWGDDVEIGHTPGL